MEKVRKESFPVAGIYVSTTNENGQGAKDIPCLWKKFWEENSMAAIPNRAGTDIYCVYTEYESDYTGAYTTLIGCRVTSLDEIPEGMKGVMIEAGNYAQLTAKGKLEDGIIINQWETVWQSGMERTYQTDYEHYGAKAANPSDAEVDIFVGIP